MKTLFPRQTVLVRRYGIATVNTPTLGGRYELGKWIEDNPAQPDFPIQISIQAPSGEEMNTFGEGRRVKSMYKCFSSVEVFTTDPLYEQNPDKTNQRDKILWNNQYFEVVHVDRWLNGILPHFEFVMLREKEIGAD